jgi:hypothetical protein
MIPKNYIRQKNGNYVVYIDGRFCDTVIEDAVSGGLSTLHNAFELEKVPSSKYASVYKFSCGIGEDTCCYYFKVFHYRSAWDFLKHFFKASRARRAIFGADMLERNGFATPTVVAAGEKRRFGMCLSNFLLTAETPLAQPLDIYFREFFVYPEPSRTLNAKREFIQEFGHFVGKLHGANISHGDLRFGNILITLIKKVHAFALLDNERTIQFEKLPERLRIKNLVQVNMMQSPGISNTDRLRFFKCYLYENSGLDWKSLARKVISKTRKRLGKSKYSTTGTSVSFCSLPN